MNKESFVFHAEYIDDLPDEYKPVFAMYIFNYAIHGTLPELTGLELTIWIKIQRRIDTDIESWENEKKTRSEAGRIGGIKSGASRSKSKQNEANEAKLNLLEAKQSNVKQNEANEAVFVSEFVNVSEFEREKEQDNISESCNSQISLSQNSNFDTCISKDYAKQVFDVLSEYNLPNCSGNFIAFLNRDFKAGLETLHSKPELHGLHSSVVIEALRNYATVLNHPNTWQGWKNRKSFDMFVSWKRFKSFLPDNFCLDNFIDREAAQQARASPESKDVKPKKRCPICGAIVDEVSQICVHCGYDYSISAIEYKKELVSPEKVTRVMHNFFGNMAEKKKELEKELEEKDE